MINIDDKYFVDVDGLCYTPKRKQPGKNKKGEDIVSEITIGHYGTIKASLRAILADCVKKQLSDGVHTLKDALNVIEKSSNYFEQILTEAIKEDI